MNIVIPKSPVEIQCCFEVWQALRPHLQRENFVEKIQRQMQQGFLLVAIEHDLKIVAGAGYRFFETTAGGKILYIDDLITLPEHRGNGYGSVLLDYLKKQAIDSLCDGIHLDSGYNRTDAHRLYLNKGFTICSHHFMLSL